MDSIATVCPQRILSEAIRLIVLLEYKAKL